MTFNPFKLAASMVGIFRRGLEYDRAVTEAEITYDKMGQEVSSKNQMVMCAACHRPFVLCNGDLIARICPLCEVMAKTMAKFNDHN